MEKTYLCSFKQSCLGVAKSSSTSFYMLTAEGISEIDNSTLHVISRIPTAQAYSIDKVYSLNVYDNSLYVFSNSPEYQIYSTDPPEFLKSVLCVEKQPYVPYSTIVAEGQIIFSNLCNISKIQKSSTKNILRSTLESIMPSLSQLSMYFVNISNLETLGQIKRLIKAKIPNKTFINMLALQPEGKILLGACSDGTVRMWDVETKEEFVPLLNTGEEKRNKKTVQKYLKKSPNPINCVEFNMTGNEIISGDDKGTAQIWVSNEDNEWKIQAQGRVSELGVLDLACFTYNGASKYLALIKEGRLLELDISGNKIKPVSIYTVSNPTPITLGKSLYVLSSKHILLLWPGSEEKMLHLLTVVNITPNKLISHLPAQPLVTLLPSPVAYPAYFYYYKNPGIVSYSILDSSISQILQVNNITFFALRPMAKPVQVLYINDSGVKYQNLETGAKAEIDGVSGIFSSQDNELAQYIIVLGDDKNNISIFDTSTLSLQTFTIVLKIKTLISSPVAYGITYETFHEHSIRLSKGFTTQVLQDVSLDLTYRLEYDEHLVSAEWNIMGTFLALATSKRICILTSSLQIHKNYSIQDIPVSIYWFGSTVLLSKKDGIYYCGDSCKILFHTFSESTICAVLNDRIYLYSDGEVRPWPCSMIEPLLWGCLENAVDKKALEQTVRIMATSSVSEQVIEKMLEKGFAEAAWYLAERNFVSLQVKIAILKELNRFEDIEKIVFRGKDSEDGHLIEEIHSDHNWKLEKTLLGEIAKFFDSKGQLQKEATFLKLSKNYWDLSLLHLSVGNKYILSESPSNNEPELEDSEIEPGHLLPELKLAYGESAYSQKVANQEILEAFTENISQWFGWDALKPPEKIVPQFMEQSMKKPREKDKEENKEKKIEDFEESEEEIEDENQAICCYLRCDEGKGTSITDVVAGKVVRINEEQWVGMLEEGEPLDYDDKWGKQASPSYRILLFKDSFVIIEDIKLPKAWSVEFWVVVNEPNCTIFTLGSLILQTDNFNFRVINSMTELEMEKTDSFRELKQGSWEHICISVKEPNLSIYISGNIVLSCKCGPVKEKTSFIMGGYSGYMTELRIWKTCRNTEQIKENYKCPLEILSEKRKKKWGNIKINKTEKKPEDVSLASSTISTVPKTEFRLPMPDKPKVELKPPGGFPRKLAMPSAAKFKPPTPKEKVQNEDPQA